MIIDIILDRKDGAGYSAKEFYMYLMQPGGGYWENQISASLDYGTNSDVRARLCEYVLANEYNPEICNYINRVNWLEDEEPDERHKQLYERYAAWCKENNVTFA